ISLRLRAISARLPQLHFHFFVFANFTAARGRTVRRSLQARQVSHADFLCRGNHSTDRGPCTTCSMDAPQHPSAKAECSFVLQASSTQIDYAERYKQLPKYQIG